MKNVAYIIDRTSGSIVVYVNGKPYTVGQDHCNYETVLECLRNKEYDDIESLINIPLAIATASNGKVVIDNDLVYYNGKQIDNVIVDRILAFISENFPFEPLVLFLENLLQNPNEDTIKECYLFLETGKLPITDDGCFLAYKKVDNDLNSYHLCPDGSKLNHAIGSLIEMPRDQVNTDRHQTCSTGLHFCSLSYLSQYSGGNGRVVIVKVNPRDVCAIPSDYSNTKGRASQYVVVGEYDAEDREQCEAFDDAYVKTEEVRESMQHVRTASGQLRDANGRFIKKSAVVDYEDDEDYEDEDYEDEDYEDEEDDDQGNTWGRKPDGTLFNNKRDSKGRFIKRT